MDQEFAHEMVEGETFADGSQEWVCPVCGRRMIIHWPPQYKRVILEEGDSGAIHTGGTGGLRMGGAEVQHEAQEEGAQGGAGSLKDPYLSPWARWLENKGL
jgi:hypothetical protein